MKIKPVLKLPDFRLTNPLDFFSRRSLDPRNPLNIIKPAKERWPKVPKWRTKHPALARFYKGKSEVREWAPKSKLKATDEGLHKGRYRESLRTGESERVNRRKEAARQEAQAHADTVMLGEVERHRAQLRKMIANITRNEVMLRASRIAAQKISQDKQTAAIEKGNAAAYTSKVGFLHAAQGLLEDGVRRKMLKSPTNNVNENLDEGLVRQLLLKHKEIFRDLREVQFIMAAHGMAAYQQLAYHHPGNIPPAKETVKENTHSRVSALNSSVGKKVS